MNAITRVFLDGTDLESDGEVPMRFRLTYTGPLKASGQAAGPLQTDKRSGQKHELRRVFHRQLRVLWQTAPFLRDFKMRSPLRESKGGTHLFPASKGVYLSGDEGDEKPMAEVLGDHYARCGYRFVPLVRESALLSCSLRVLMLRRDFPKGVLSAGDIDNRVKTLVDALRMPGGKSEVPDDPREGEDPFFVLLDDDKQITHLEVETDACLDVPEPDDPSYAQVIISVDVRPYYATNFNLGFA